MARGTGTGAGTGTGTVYSNVSADVYGGGGPGRKLKIKTIYRPVDRAHNEYMDTLAATTTCGTSEGENVVNSAQNHNLPSSVADPLHFGTDPRICTSNGSGSADPYL